VRQHYNAVPERGRDWRKTDSRIKGLRSFNNWVKSCIIQKFSPDEDHSPGARERGISSGNKLLILDIGCGKGGDLGKWQQAPQPVDLYVGLDPAEVSIEQARDRYRNMLNRGGGGRGGRGGRGGYHDRRPQRIFDGRFQVKDCFGESLGDIDIVREVGFGMSHINANRGFDVVSMMFCMHYAFESEQKARQMLKNVAGALKKGGRFIGCIPNSHVIGEKVEEFNKKLAARKAAEAAKKAAEAEKEKAANGEQQSNGADGGDQEPPQSPPFRAGSSSPPYQPKALAEEEEEEGEASEENKHKEKAVSEDGEIEEGEVKSGQEDNSTEPKKDEEKSEPEFAEWGNDIYRVRFSGPTPADGVFRPPFGWKYNFFLHEAVEEVPEYVVPWEAFRALAEDYNLEMQYHKTFREVWETEKDDRELGPLSERMGVRERGRGPLLVSPEEMEAASFYVAFCFYKV